MYERFWNEWPSRLSASLATPLRLVFRNVGSQRLLYVTKEIPRFVSTRAVVIVAYVYSFRYRIVRTGRFVVVTNKYQNYVHFLQPVSGGDTK